MNKPEVGHVILACTIAAVLSGCTVDPDYASDKIKNANPEMTLFQNGISVPMIKSTVELRADSLIKSISDSATREAFSVRDGKYELGFSGHDNLDSLIRGMKLSDVLKVDPVEVETSLSFKYGGPVPVLLGSVKEDSLVFNVDEELVFDIIRNRDIPDMLVSAEKIYLKDVVSCFSLELEGLPSIGSGARYVVDMKAELSRYVSPSVISIKGEIRNGKFTGQPVAMESLDLSGFDFPEMKSCGKGLECSAKVTGRIYAENPEVEVGSLSGKVDGNLKMSVSGPDDRIKIKSIRARMDYREKAGFYVNMKDFNSSVDKRNFNLPDITDVLVITSNLAIPAKATAKVTPVKGTVEDDSKSVTRELVFPYCEDPSKSDSVTNKIVVNINDILNSKPDSIKFVINFTTDTSRDCYIETEAAYTMDLGYNLTVPLNIGAGTSLEIADTVGLDGSLSGLEEILSNSSFGITGNIESTFPIGISVKFDFLSLDKESGIYKAIPLKTVEADLVEPNSTSSFEIVTGPEKPGTAIPEITHLSITCKLTSDGKDICPSSYLKIKNLAIVLPEGVTFSLENL